MAKTLEQIDAQIEKLNKAKEALKAKEVAGVIARIKVAIAHYGLTAVDLGLAKQMGRKPGSKSKAAKAVGEAAVLAPAVKKTSGKKGAARKAAPKAPRKAKVAKAPGVAKYSDGAGNSWTGNGKRPKWFLDAIAGGKTAEDLLVKPTA